ncbi:RHS repeat domain-containing protein [Limnobacter humi]|uniref:RHS repeat domain-containing protein n=1 Tax=Limnobacter humi TaxID=1778671 RepID=UPI0027420F06|nr:RHS repeat-associated core domain-containing protein [Limnobacter humi]
MGIPRESLNCTAHYTYDPLGRRASKTVQWADGRRSTVQFYWQGPTLLAEYETRHGQGTVQDHSTHYLYKPGSFEPVAQVADGQVQHIHTDHLGTPRELSNGQGQWVWKARYRTYGALALQEEAVEEQNPSACKLRFQGQYWDEESGLHYNLNRYHDPQTGQFISQDPIGLAGGLNLYQYAPNPVTWVDPWGLTCKEYEYNMVESPGPLAEMPGQPATNFSSGKYNQKALVEDKIYYRGGKSGGGKNAFGQWFNTSPPESVAKVRIDNAVKPQWIDPNSLVLQGQSPIDTVYAIKIPKGTTVFEGPVGYQGGLYVGGQEMMQTFIPKPWSIPGVEVISEIPLK